MRGNRLWSVSECCYFKGIKSIGGRGDKRVRTLIYIYEHAHEHTGFWCIYEHAGCSLSSKIKICEVGGGGYCLS
jgi:hypothetical protein